MFGWSLGAHMVNCGQDGLDTFNLWNRVTLRWLHCIIRRFTCPKNVTASSWKLARNVYFPRQTPELFFYSYFCHTTGVINSCDGRSFWPL